MYKRSINIHYFPRKLIIENMHFFFFIFVLISRELAHVKGHIICYHKRIAHGYVHISYILYTHVLSVIMFIYVSKFILYFMQEIILKLIMRQTNKSDDWIISCFVRNYYFWIFCVEENLDKSHKKKSITRFNRFSYIKSLV